MTKQQQDFLADIKADLVVETWPIERLIPYARNPRKNDAQVDRMASAIKEFGFRIPIVAKSDGSVVDGHLRLKAAHKFGLHEVPVALADELTEAQVKAFRILANKSANWAEWDEELLVLEMEELKALDFDLEMTGFEPEEITTMLDAQEQGIDEKYESKMVSPVYEPTGEKPALSDCYDIEKWQKLVAEIDASAIPNTEKEFLRNAAARHIVFNY